MKSHEGPVCKDQKNHVPPAPSIHQTGWNSCIPEALFRYSPNSINKRSAKVTMQDLHVVTICKVFCLPTLGHDIADISDFCLGFQKSLADFFNHDIGQKSR